MTWGYRCRLTWRVTTARTSLRATGGWQARMTQTPRRGDPREDAFDDPAAGQDVEPSGCRSISVVIPSAPQPHLSHERRCPLADGLAGAWRSGGYRSAGPDRIVVRRSGSPNGPAAATGPPPGRRAGPDPVCSAPDRRWRNGYGRPRDAHRALPGRQLPRAVPLRRGSRNGATAPRASSRVRPAGSRERLASASYPGFQTVWSGTAKLSGSCSPRRSASDRRAVIWEPASTDAAKTIATRSTRSLNRVDGAPAAPWRILRGLPE